MCRLSRVKHTCASKPVNQWPSSAARTPKAAIASITTGWGEVICVRVHARARTPHCTLSFDREYFEYLNWVLETDQRNDAKNPFSRIQQELVCVVSWNASSLPHTPTTTLHTHTHIPHPFVLSGIIRLHQAIEEEYEADTDRQRFSSSLYNSKQLCGE